MKKPLNKTLFIVGLVFIFSYALSLLAAFLANSFSPRLALYLFFASLFSSIAAFTISGGFFASVIDYWLQLRRILKVNNLSHPLLLRLSKEAPGTYHHSILVADLASRAAKEINADTALARVGAYFHDIGKLHNASIFVENRNNHKQENAQEDPQRAAKRIIAHAKDGVRLAMEYHLPKEAINTIAQHHGTIISKYYFQKAKERDPSTAKRSLFRYEGPKPQTKEAAIVMLADAIEAASRPAKEKLNTPDDFQRFVDEVVGEKEQDGQLKEADLSEKDIFKIKKSFASTLLNMFHPRIEYPKGD